MNSTPNQSGQVTTVLWQWFRKVRDWILSEGNPSGSKTASFTADRSYFYYPCDATSGNITATLPDNKIWAGKKYVFKKTDSSSHTVIVTAAGADTIDGNATVTLTTKYEEIEIASDGRGNWYIFQHWLNSGSGASIGGSDTQVQYNKAGVFGGDANLIWDYTNKRLELSATATIGLLGFTAPITAISMGTANQPADGYANLIRLYDDGAAATSNTSNSYGFGMQSSSGRFSISAGTAGNIGIYTANTLRQTIWATGQIHIGPYNAAGIERLYVEGAGTGIPFGSAGVKIGSDQFAPSGFLHAQNGTTGNYEVGYDVSGAWYSGIGGPSLTLGFAGNVGVNLASGSTPAQPLEVLGQIQQDSLANGATCLHGIATELLTLSTSGLTTQTSGNLLPANSIIDAVCTYVTTTITSTTNWAVGDSTTTSRFSSANGTKTAGTSQVGLNHMSGAVTTLAAGPTQAAAAKIQITCTGANPGAGVVRITVFYRTFTAPTS